MCLIDRASGKPERGACLDATSAGDGIGMAPEFGVEPLAGQAVARWHGGRCVAVRRAAGHGVTREAGSARCALYASATSAALVPVTVTPHAHVTSEGWVSRRVECSMLWIRRLLGGHALEWDTSSSTVIWVRPGFHAGT